MNTTALVLLGTFAGAAMGYIVAALSYERRLVERDVLLSRIMARQARDQYFAEQESELANVVGKYYRQ